MYKLVKENIGLFISNKLNLNENMQQAKTIFTKNNIPLDDQRFIKLKELLVNHYGYIGKFAKWLIEDKEPFESIVEVYNMLKNATGKIPEIHKFNKLEDLYDYLQETDIDTKVRSVINELPSMQKKFATDQLKNLIKLNIEWADALKDFYKKKSSRYKTAKHLYDDTEGQIRLWDNFSLEKILKKIKDNNLNVDIVYQSPLLLIIRPGDYKTSCEIGSKSWCISTSKQQWGNYADDLSNQYFIYDFTKEPSDIKSMIGITISPLFSNADGSHSTIRAAHYKDDSVADKKYVETLLSDI